MEALNHVRRATSATSAHVNTVTMLLAFLVHDQSGVLVNAQQTPGCGSNPPASGKKRLTVDDPIIGRVDRSYQIYVPRNYNSFLETALVLDFHGYTGTSDRQAEETGIKYIADEYNFIAVWPQGLDDTVVPRQQAYSWNSVGTVESPGPSGDTCKWAARREWNGYPCHSSCEKTRGCLSNAHAGSCDCATCADDVLFIERLLGELESTMCIARSRVFITGFSNGGMMAFQLAQSRIANRFAAIVTVGASPLLGFGAEPTVPMPLMEIHGSADKIIPANVTGQSGPGGSTISSDGYYYEPVDRTMAKYASKSGCKGNPVHYRTQFDGDSGLWCVSPGGNACSQGGPVVRCSHKGGHTWPFSSNNREQFALMAWEFMTNAVSLRKRASALNATSGEEQ